MNSSFDLRLVEVVALRRDRQACSALFTYFAPRLKGIALKRDILVAAAEELARETMLAVWCKADTFVRNRASVSTWVFHHRSQQAHRSVSTRNPSGSRAGAGR
ncbi:MAG: hypothetical protein IPK78_16510 [Rhodospirillales bacterium]|nr:hypothetical protein [Rhodospirillales bacterium]